jgi:NADH:ubiquinone oxidoreductase subunit 6 (subunit J)
MLIEILNFIFGFVLSFLTLVIFGTSNILLSIFVLILLFIFSGIYILFLGYEFLGIIFALIMAGAIGIFFIFVVMMLDLTDDKTQYILRTYYVKSNYSLIIYLIVLMFVLIISEWLINNFEIIHTHLFLVYSYGVIGYKFYLMFDSKLETFWIDYLTLSDDLFIDYFSWIEIINWESNLTVFSIYLYNAYIWQFIIVGIILFFTLIYIIRIINLE